MQLRIALPNGEEHPYEVTAETTYASFVEHASGLVAGQCGVELYLGDEVLNEASWAGVSDGDRVRVAADVYLRLFLPDGGETMFEKTADTTYIQFKNYAESFVATHCADRFDRFRHKVVISGPGGDQITSGAWEELKNGDVITLSKESK